MREIGSEFWMKYDLSDIKTSGNEVYLLSGRTALRYIIDDICQTRIVRRALLPSYCCESMIEPFISAGIHVDFYHVQNTCIDYPFENEADVVFLIDFFGYMRDQNTVIACTEKNAGKTVIYDATHKLDGNCDVQKYADYSFCSYRKWFYCNFAKAEKHDGEFFNNQFLHRNEAYVKVRNEAAELKRKYVSNLSDDKDVFLSKFSAAEQMLDEGYIGYAGEAVEFDLNEIRTKRRENAEYLINELKAIPEIQLWNDTLHRQDTPLFVPILVDSQVRNDLRKQLINEKIYCPIHWPVSRYHTKSNDLYNTELSLVCDQRYDIADMKRIVRVIKHYFNR